MKKKKKLSKKVILITLILALTLLVLLAIQYDVWNINITKKIKHIKIMDECSIMVGKLIHQIKDSDGCKLKCLAECDINKMKFYDSEFLLKNESCHNCECYCR